MEPSYTKMNDMMALHEQGNVVEFKPKYVELGQNYFLQNQGKQRENGMKLVRQYDWVSIRHHVHGIKSDDYPFYDEYPNCREVLLLGVGSSGKSSIINALNGAYGEGVGGEEVAHVARWKGKTQQLNFYHTGHRFKRKKMQGMLVDAPGYGRLDTPVKLRHKLWKMNLKYLCYGVRLNMILLCIQAHRGLQQIDLDILEQIKYFNKAVHIVITKIDKVDDHRNLVSLMNEISHKVMKYDYFVKPEIHLVSAHDAFGIQELRARIGLAFELPNYNQNYFNKPEREGKAKKIREFHSIQTI
mmetsp:Transcript_1647/g.2911  ORF Transcript_1647/g.2911 Transcript_1647/m.2911 type:complete len:299 (-) Transcript_1647:18-914(-)